MILATKEKDGKRVVDIEWFRSMSDDALEERVTQVLDSRDEAQAMVLDMRDAMLRVLVKHELCPAHWLRDGCPIEVLGKRSDTGSQYESDLRRVMGKNKELWARIKKLENEKQTKDDNGK